MPDLTHELHWVCQPWADYRQMPETMRKEMPTPDCSWNSYADDGDPVKTKDGFRCPKCGEPVIGYWAGV